MGGLAAAWLTFVAVQTYQYEKHNAAALPPATMYIGSGLVYSLLGLFAIAQPRAAAVLGWGWLVGAVVGGGFGQGVTQAQGGKRAGMAGAAPPAGGAGGVKAPPLPSGASQGPRIGRNAPAPLVAPPGPTAPLVPTFPPLF